MIPKAAMGGWRGKALLQQVFSRVPGGQRLNWFFNRRVTHSYPVSDKSLQADVELGDHHVSRCRAHGSVPIEDAAFFEFGAGWDLAMPLILARAGVTRQTVVDLRPLARDELIAGTAERLGLSPPLRGIADLGTLGIDYRAPADARHTELPDRSIDFITSTNTLEHIPRSDLAAILRECRRILADDGVMSFQVDYKDHYSYFDDRIGPYHFLRYGDRHWRLYNPPIHFQNRLRHDDYLHLYEKAGFEVVEDDIEAARTEDLTDLADLAATSVRGHGPPPDLASLGIRGARTVLRKAATG